MVIDHSNLRLGKRPRRHDPRTLKLARYMTPALPHPPDRVDYTRGITDWGMMLNDRLGDCTIADGPGHATQVWTLNAAGAMVTPPDSVILETYEQWCGYNPADPATDRGGVELDVLNHWRQQGFGGQALDAYGAIEPENRNSKLETRNSTVLPRVSNDDLRFSDVATAIWLFGGAYIGVELPISAQKQDVWDVPENPGPDDEPGSWGGHAVYLVGYDTGLPIADCRLSIEKQSLNPSSSSAQVPSPIPDGKSSIVNRQSTITCITWGQLKKMTWAWFERYCSEAYALVSKEWLNASAVSPSGFDLAALENDLKLVAA